MKLPANNRGIPVNVSPNDKEWQASMPALDRTMAPPSQQGAMPQQGYPPQQGGMPQQGYPTQQEDESYLPQEGGTPLQQGYPSPQQDVPPPQQDSPPPQQGYPPPQQDVPPPQQDLPPPQQGYQSPQQDVPPPQQGYPPPQQGHPPQNSPDPAGLNSPTAVDEPSTDTPRYAEIHRDTPSTNTPRTDDSAATADEPPATGDAPPTQVDGPPAEDTPRTESCEDTKDVPCASLAAIGECKRIPVFMHSTCALSCGCPAPASSEELLRRERADQAILDQARLSRLWEEDPPLALGHSSLSGRRRPEEIAVVSAEALAGLAPSERRRISRLWKQTGALSALVP